MSQPPAPDSDILGAPGSAEMSLSPDPGPDSHADLRTSLTSSVAGSENTVVAAAQCWTNTFDSNMTDTSVDEPKYARVQHKKRNSKVGSGNSTPKLRRKDAIDSGSSRFAFALLQLFPVNHFVIHEGIIIFCDGKSIIPQQNF